MLLPGARKWQLISPHLSRQNVYFAHLHKSCSIKNYNSIKVSSFFPVALRILHGPWNPRHLDSADRRRSEFGLLSRHAFPPRTTSRRAGNPLGRHGWICHVVSEGGDASRNQG
jgi:hypothetical protein